MRDYDREKLAVSIAKDTVPLHVEVDPYANVRFEDGGAWVTAEVWVPEEALESDDEETEVLDEPA